MQYGIRTLYPEEVSGLYLGDGGPLEGVLHFFGLSTTDINRLCLPSNFLINVHFRFANALHLFYIEDKIAHGWPSEPRGKDYPLTLVISSLTFYKVLPYQNSLELA